MSVRPARLWGVLWHSKNALDGTAEHLMCREGGSPVIFWSRRVAREWIREHYGYIAHRLDLRREPHGWRMPKPVRVTISVEEADE